MFPSKAPVLYILHTLGIFFVILFSLMVGMILKQPLAILSILALGYLPDWPLVHGPDDQEDQDPGYDGKAKFGFAGAPHEH